MKRLITEQIKRGREIFRSNASLKPEEYEPVRKIHKAIRVADFGIPTDELEHLWAEKQPKEAVQNNVSQPNKSKTSTALTLVQNKALMITKPDGQVQQGPVLPAATLSKPVDRASDLPVVVKQDYVRINKPEWHAPWKLTRVVTGHQGWVRAITVDWSNEWFASGGDDRSIKIWDLAAGKLKVTLTGHISAVMGLRTSPVSPYLFSVGQDKMVKCWDLEVNKQIRQYHGHLSGVYCLDIFQNKSVDILATGGRDGTVRIWDMRTKKEEMCLASHVHTVHAIQLREDIPELISGSQDCTIRCWDLRKQSTIKQLTNHKKAIRALKLNPTENNEFISCGADNIKKWDTSGEFMLNYSGHDTIVHSLAMNEEGVVFTGGDNGTMKFWDYRTGYNFQSMDTIAQPGSLESETAIFTATFDHTGLRLLTGEGDKTIKVWKEDDNASEVTHPINWRPPLQKYH